MEEKNSAYGWVDEEKRMMSEMEQMVSSYDSYMKRITIGRERTLREMTVVLAGVKAGDCVLEVGCGTGSLTLAAKRQAGPSGKVFGIDILPGMIELSQDKAAQADEDITFQLGNMDDIPFPENLFDVVMCSFMIFHMSETRRRKGIAEIHRVLKPQGRLLILDLALPSPALPRAIAKMLFGGMLQHDLRELLPLIESSGFLDVEIAPAKFTILGLSILAYVRGRAQKG